MPNVFGKTAIFGSGAGDAHPIVNATASSNPQALFEEILMFPMRVNAEIMNMLLAPFQPEEKPAPPPPGSMGVVRFAPHGEIIPKEGTSTLNKQNIF